MGEDGVTKAALLLIALGAEDAAEALRHLDPKEVQKVTAGMARIKKFKREALDNAVRDFIKQANTHTTFALGADEYQGAVASVFWRPQTCVEFAPSPNAVINALG